VPWSVLKTALVLNDRLLLVVELLFCNRVSGVRGLQNRRKLSTRLSGRNTKSGCESFSGIRVCRAGHSCESLWKTSRLYVLTSICVVKYIASVESVFEIIAEPNRRAILSLLVSSQQSVGEIERYLRMPQPTVSKHLRVLRDAGFVESTVDAQRRLYRLKPEPFQEVDAWLAPFRRFWSAHVDALERHLDRMDQMDLPAPTKRKISGRRRGPNREHDKGEKK
jgi:DNA-binding transcriptional ArsR family regulator